MNLKQIPAWTPGTHKTGTLVEYQGVIYERTDHPIDVLIGGDGKPGSPVTPHPKAWRVIPLTAMHVEAMREALTEIEWWRDSDGWSGHTEETCATLRAALEPFGRDTEESTL